MDLARLLRRWLPWAIGYAVLLGAVVMGTFKIRDWAFSQLATPKSVADWREWRDDVRQLQDQPGPVQRRVPKSSEPPALVMMRDHFAVSLLAAVLFSTMLYWVLAWFVFNHTAA
jgi:hypothetical protein